MRTDEKKEYFHVRGIKYKGFKKPHSKKLKTTICISKEKHISIGNKQSMTINKEVKTSV